jgi:hypothetical protein
MDIQQYNLNKNDTVASTESRRKIVPLEKSKGSYTLSLFGGRVKKKYATLADRANVSEALANSQFKSAADLIDAVNSVPTGFATPNAPKVKGTSTLLSVNQSDD